MGRFALFTLGCKVNQAECEELALRLGEAGSVELVLQPEERTGWVVARWMGAAPR